MIIIKKQDRTDYILNGVAEYYGVTRDQLIKRTRNPERMNRKRMTMYILYEIADLNLKDIACCMDYRVLSLPAVYQHIATFRDNLEGKECKRQYKELLEFLELN